MKKSPEKKKSADLLTSNWQRSEITVLSSSLRTKARKWAQDTMQFILKEQCL